MNKDIKEIEKIIKDLLKIINIKSNISVIKEESQNRESIKINLESPDSALLIGYRGANLAALQHIVNIIWQSKNRKENPEQISAKIILDVGSYKSQRLDSIEKMAKDLAEKVIKTGYAEVLPVMSSYERRAVHTALADSKGIITESVGEDPYRRIIIKIRSKN